MDRGVTSARIRIGRVPVIILRRRASTGQTTGLLWIHGGGYILGMKEMIYFSRAMDFVREFGVTVFSPGYHLAWQKPYPAAVQDCFAVLEAMYADADKLGIRRNQLMAGGESAGGGLAAAVCMMARGRGIPVAFQMPLYPMLSNIDTESSRDNHGKIWNTRRNHPGWRMYLRDQANSEVSPYASPVWQKDYSNLPPCYTFVGDGEPFHAETLQYVDALRDAGGIADVDVYHTDIHAFDLMRPGLTISRTAIQRCHERLEYALTHYYAL